MRINLINGWKNRLPRKPKIYPVNPEERKLIDNTFDILHQQRRMEYITQATPIIHSVFVVWRNLADEKRKSQVIVDIRQLNNFALRDAYPLLLQTDIIEFCRGKRYISVMDGMSFFYQWRMYPELQAYLSVMTHRGQKAFKITVMGFKNSVSYQIIAKSHEKVDAITDKVSKLGRDPAPGEIYETGGHENVIVETKRSAGMNVFTKAHSAVRSPGRVSMPKLVYFSWLVGVSLINVLACSQKLTPW